MTTTKNTIQVLIVGSAGEGKSTIAALLKQSLTNFGFEADINDDNGIGIVDEPPGTIEQSLEQRVASLRERTRVSVRTKQANGRCNGACGRRRRETQA